MSRLKLLVDSHLLWDPMFIPRPAHAGFVVEKVAMEQAFLQILQFSPVGTTTPCSTTIHSSTTDTLQDVS
jgi:hypothetical protein